MLRTDNLDVSYGPLQVLWNVSVHVDEGEIVALLGPNGAGKSTLLNSISALAGDLVGEIRFRGERIDGLPTHEIVDRGLVHVLERRRVFPYLTVEQNLILGSWLPRAREKRAHNLDRVLSLMPDMADKLALEARRLSGGQQQQLAIGRGLMSAPRLLMLDEPMLGLYPAMVDTIANTIRQLRDDGITILFIEQNVDLALELSDRAYVLQSGRVALEGRSSQLASGSDVSDVFMGRR